MILQLRQLSTPLMSTSKQPGTSRSAHPCYFAVLAGEEWLRQHRGAKCWASLTERRRITLDSGGIITGHSLCKRRIRVSPTCCGHYDSKTSVRDIRFIHGRWFKKFLAFKLESFLYFSFIQLRSVLDLFSLSVEQCPFCYVEQHSWMKVLEILSFMLLFFFF